MEHLQNEKDIMLWKLAKKRVGFRNHFYMFLFVNGAFWTMWWFGNDKDKEGGVPWPTFCTLGWGFGILWHFMGAYVFHNKTSQVEKEFNKLKEKV